MDFYGGCSLYTVTDEYAGGGGVGKIDDTSDCPSMFFIWDFFLDFDYLSLSFLLFSFLDADLESFSLLLDFDLDFSDLSSFFFLLFESPAIYF
jgi:hypothetical protein